ncbi:MAG: prepilin-type N-terminal cleavage/methylation domain-containing protein [Candidatus Omnitrophica bacterium]|nr:prepilin-type N-terminal cleavage/methylation domain-containing protein [Candidatus Omnitrophota bacterium]
MRVNKAFSLVEMLLAVIIVGIILALAVPNFSSGYARFQLNKTADDLLGISRWAQAMAIGQERIYVLSFSNDRRSYSLVCAKAALQNDETWNIEKESYPDSFEPVKGALGRMHIIPDGVNLDTQDDRIEFYPDGMIDRAVIELDSPLQKIVLSSVLVRGVLMKVDNE